VSKLNSRSYQNQERRFHEALESSSYLEWDPKVYHW